MKSSNFFGRIGELEIWSAAFAVITGVAVVTLHHYGVIHRGDPLVLGLYLLTFAPLLLLRIWVHEFSNDHIRQTWDAGAEQALPMIWAKKSAIKIKEIHVRTFPWDIKYRGSVGKNITPIVTHQREASGRQSGASKSRRQASGSKNSGDDSDGGDGEPPHQLFTYSSLALLLDCSPKTLRNKVAAGLIPAPLPTVVGPRFTSAQIRALIDPPLPTPQKAAPKRCGRPRIAAMSGKGAQS